MTNANPIYGNAINNLPAIDIKGTMQLVQRHSINCTWEQSMKCPCIDSKTGQPKPNCKICHGQGIVFYNSNTIDIAVYNDIKKEITSNSGIATLPETTATIQLTAGGIEQGVKIGDRITIDGWETPENFLFNVTDFRLNSGIFVPYKFSKINDAFCVSDEGSLEKIDIDNAFEVTDNFIKVKDSNLLNKTISINIAAIKRFYITSLQKELRYQKYVKYDDKNWGTGLGNTYLTYGDIIKGSAISSGEFIVKMYPKVTLRRENLYFSDVDLVSSETDNNRVISDPRVVEMNNTLGGY